MKARSHLLNLGLLNHGSFGDTRVFDFCLGTILREGGQGELRLQIDFRGLMGPTKWMIPSS